MPVRKLVFALLGLLSILALALCLWAPFLSLLPGGNLEFLGGAGRVRLGSGCALVLLLILRALVRPPEPPSRRAVAWAEFATRVGGTVTEERRGLGVLGWSGGRMVRWESRGIGITLSTTTDSDRNTDTHFTADVRMARPFQIHVVHESLLTKALFAAQLWHVALRAVRGREGRGDAGGAVGSLGTGAGIADRLAFLGGKEILAGDPAIDDAFLIKTDAPDLAREFVVDPGVSCSLREVNESVKGWQMSLMWQGASEHQLTLVVPGGILEPRELEACRVLMEASLRCLADRGFLESSSARAA